MSHVNDGSGAKRMAVFCVIGYMHRLAHGDVARCLYRVVTSEW